VSLNTSAGPSAKNDEQREIQEHTAPSAGFDGLGTSNEQDDTQHTRAEAMTVDLAPLPGFPVQRDLIADIDQMMEQIKRLKPYLQASGQLHTTQDGAVNMFEYLQSPEELQRFELLSNCIACGVCEGSCPVYAGGEAFIGPAALVINSRFINDSRDDATRERLDDISDADGIAACQSVRACSRHCPKGIDVGEEMWKLVELRPSGR
jgi:succinate dehydrogenase / fumarate reductase iron-sulfur subunit